jgi:hypothetical protein
LAHELTLRNIIITTISIFIRMGMVTIPTAMVIIHTVMAIIIPITTEAGFSAVLGVNTIIMVVLVEASAVDFTVMDSMVAVDFMGVAAVTAADIGKTQ